MASHQPTRGTAMNNPVQHARDALAGRIEVEPPTVICEVCDREIDASTAWAIPAIGFMCPRGTKDCKPQRSIWDEVRESDEYDKTRRIDSIIAVFEDACSDYADF